VHLISHKTATYSYDCMICLCKVRTEKIPTEFSKLTINNQVTAYKTTKTVQQFVKDIYNNLSIITDFVMIYLINRTCLDSNFNNAEFIDVNYDCSTFD